MSLPVPPSRGLFIVFEGLDRSGKSTQLAMLGKRLRELGREVELMKSPDRSTLTGGMINSYLLTPPSERAPLPDQAIHLLFSANRWEDAQRVRQRLEEGKTVLMDRYAFSGVAYSAAKGLDWEWCKAGEKGLPKPDCVLYVEVDEDTQSLSLLCRTRGGFGGERYEVSEFQSKVRKMFERFSKGEDVPFWTAVDGRKEPEEVHQEVYEVVRPLLGGERGKVGDLWTSNLEREEGA